MKKKNVAIISSVLVVAVLFFIVAYFQFSADVSGYYSKQADEKSYSAMVTKQKDGGYKISYSLKSKEGAHTLSHTSLEFLVSEQIVLGKRIVGTYVLQERDDKEDQFDVEVVFKKDTLTVSGLEKKDIVLDKVNIKSK